jgi:L-ascorbate metabolism protein UlaG (beta-lactamase superfamily)
MIELTYLGHSSFLVKIKDKNLIFDPFISPNPQASIIKVNELKSDYVFVSHGHEDHLADAEQILKNTKSILISNFEIVEWFKKKGIENFHPMNHGGSKLFDFGHVKYVTAVHSSTLPDGTSGGNAGGFVITHDKGAFYFAGDTALTYDMKLIGEEFSIDFAILPIGDNFTMGIKDAIKAAKFVGTNTIVGMHYNTFSYIEMDLEAAKNLATKEKINLVLCNIGEIVIL